jgi:hypothetical protein
MDVAALLPAEGDKHPASKANGVNEDMKRSNGTLVDEMKRSSGEQK